MKRFINHSAMTIAAAILFFIALNGSAFGQTDGVTFSGYLEDLATNL